MGAEVLDDSIDRGGLRGGAASSSRGRGGTKARSMATRQHA
jgi:hypothetical protein